MSKENLSDMELRKITLGYKWNPSMSFEEFRDSNKMLCMDKAYNVWDMIEKRYVEYFYENN